MTKYHHQQLLCSIIAVESDRNGKVMRSGALALTQVKSALQCTI